MSSAADGGGSARQDSVTCRRGSGRRLVLNLVDGASRYGAGVRLLCCPGKVVALVLKRGGVHTRCRAVGVNSRCCCGLAGLHRWVRGMTVGWNSARIRECFRMSPMASPMMVGGEVAIEGCVGLITSAGAWREAELGAGSGSSHLASCCRLYRAPGSAWWCLPRGGTHVGSSVNRWHAVSGRCQHPTSQIHRATHQLGTPCAGGLHSMVPGTSMGPSKHGVPCWA